MARYPHLEVVHLPAGHSVNIEAAGAFNAAVQQFLAKRSPGLPSAGATTVGPASPG